MSYADQEAGGRKTVAIIIVALLHAALAYAFITGGYGTLSTNTMDYVGAAINSGTLGMAYCPKSATITADLSKLSGPARAHWYDPTNGKFREIADSPFANSGSQGFSTPGSNSTGDEDWVLLLEAEP